MSRTTITDALPHVNSKYELGMLGAQRVRDLNGGTEPVVSVNNDKPTVTALREIASGKLDVPALRQEFVQSYKDTPVIENAAALETKSEDPALRELDLELENTLVTTDSVTAAELEGVIDDSTVDADEEPSADSQE